MFNIFYYDESSPSCLRWKIERRRGPSHRQVFIEVGDVAGSFSEYWRVEHLDKSHYVHRIIWEIAYGEIPKGYVIDHFDRDKSNNRLSNLRCIPFEVNVRNAFIQSNNTSGVTGVKFNKRGYWVSQWYEDGKMRVKYFSVKSLGNSTAFEQACSHRLEQIQKLNDNGAGYTTKHGGK